MAGRAAEAEDRDPNTCMNLYKPGIRFFQSVLSVRLTLPERLISDLF